MGNWDVNAWTDDKLIYWALMMWCNYIQDKCGTLNCDQMDFIARLEALADKHLSKHLNETNS